ncbi:MAG: hypothetical protein AB2L07_14740 [Thermoanaerobaculaceae bacterium]
MAQAQVAPSITTHPAVQDVCSGQSVTLTVQATGTPPLSYQWYEGVSPVGTLIAGATGSSYSTPPITTNRSFWVRVTNAYGSAHTNTAVLTVKSCSAPSITTHPAVQDVCSGHSVTLTVQATGAPPLSYQWYEGVSPVGTLIPGATGSSYSTPPITTNRSFWVRVTNAYGSAHTNTAVLTVKSCSAPSITTHPAVQDVCSGQSVTLTVQATGTPPLSYQWYEGVSPVGTLIAGATGSSYSTPPITTNRSFWVRVTNAYGSAHTNTAVLTVKSCSAPSITTHPAVQDVCSGHSVTLTVQATGAPPLSYQWYEGVSPVGTLIPGATGSSYSTPPITTNRSFWVRVTNAYGSAHTNTAVLTVKSCSSIAVWLVVASHAGGLHNSQWRTDLGVTNPNPSTANFEVRFHGASSVLTSTAFVTADGQSILQDVVGQLGGTGSGAIEVRADQPIRVTGRTYNLVSPAAGCYPNGTLGQDYVGFKTEEGLVGGQAAILGQLTENSAYRTNIGLTNAGIGQATVTVTLYDGAGGQLTTYTVTLGPGEWKQENQPFRNKAGQTNMQRGWAKVTVTAGSGVYAYASVIDNITNDPTTIPMQR